MVYFQTKNPNFCNFFEGLRKENVVTFSGHLKYFTAIRYILLPFGNVVIIWLFFPVLV
jgi:hypothetical protein